MTILIAIDDTDTKESRGTGRLARTIADSLRHFGSVAGVTRHQLFVHPSIPYTSHNSCAVIHLQTPNGVTVPEIVDFVSGKILDDFIEGSDPGLAVAPTSGIGELVVKFGQDAKKCVLSRGDAVTLAERIGIALVGLGGSCDGVIGALAGLGLASSGNDGRYVMKGRLRELSREARVEDLLLAGVDEVHTMAGERVKFGTVRMRKFPKPSLRNHRAVLFVEERDGSFDEVVRD